MLRWKASHNANSHSNPPLTPDPSPQTSPVVSVWDSDDDTVMSGEEYIQIRPKSISSSREGGSPSSTPLLVDVLNNISAPPYTLSAFTAFLSQNHCLETLEFVMAARRYQEKYDSIIPTWTGMGTPTFDVPEVRELQMDWRRLIDTFLSPGAPREINLPSIERDALLRAPYTVRPPPPEGLEPAVKRMHDLMQESIWMPFLHHQAPKAPLIQTYDASPVPSPKNDMMDLSRDERQHLNTGARKGHSPSSSSDFNAPRSPIYSYGRPLSTLTTALSKPTSGGGKITHQISHTSAGSSIREYALTDDSGSSPTSGQSDVDLMTPPTTPPSSDLGMGPHNHSHKSRTDSGAWKRMGAKLHWPRKKSVGTLRPQTLHEEYD